ncbi:unnamed protein product [Mytilus edulis]|uniref:Uncharacterized protein n=1 Tax=Mytilus edulis TaxID=6550 RepID=A0A8S3T8C8_MYTED|nr:unnamed protein product [Mytilus edulis]
MHQPSNGSSTQEEYSREHTMHQMSLQIKNGLQPSNESQHRRIQQNNASTIKWVFNTGRIQQEQCINHQMGLQHRRIQQETMHQPSNGSSTQGEYSRTMHQPSNESSTQENTAGNNASTIKWVFNTGRIQQGTMHQPSNGSSTQEKYSREQCINHQMSLQHRKNTAGNNASTIKWVFNTGRIQQGTMHQPSNESSTQENTAGNNASTIKWVFNTGEYSREQCINHQMGLQHR